jgi:hypothetical protein
MSDAGWQCFNAGTTTTHWDQCSQRRFAKIKATGEYFETDASKGYLTDLKPSGIQFTFQSSGVKRGKHPIKECGQCVPPWLECPNQCPNAL